MVQNLVKIQWKMNERNESALRLPPAQAATQFALGSTLQPTGATRAGGRPAPDSAHAGDSLVASSPRAARQPDHPMCDVGPSGVVGRLHASMLGSAHVVAEAAPAQPTASRATTEAQVASPVQLSSGATRSASGSTHVWVPLVR